MSTTTTETLNPSKTWFAGGALVTVLVLLLAGAMVWSWLSGESRPNTESQSQIYRQPIGRIEISSAAGDLTVSAGPDGEVGVDRRLEWTAHKPTYTEQWNGDTLRITVRCPDGKLGCSVHYTIRVPRSISVRAHTDAGDLDIRDLSGDIKAETEAGRTTLENTKGKLYARSGNGDLTATGITSAEIDLGTGAGHVDLRLSGVPSLVRTSSGAGDVRVRVPANPSGYQVRADTNAGRRVVEVQDVPASPHRIEASTSAGDVTVAGS
ncbi:hypothetical protein DMC61_21885 [Amycolatopsis sp. WAC 04169]|uniref:DUF4097 family beta strand repeat-containing protein n=1 Tax=Amycolatopsis sp. WAC 04169 TaxID=2203197 RepID=UPI000F7A742D|nr:DUF4097 family beta strand repeat-containing protein [Amycolatopsis sp. WAC 04169]RSN29154.1 hypothetical protein DMC61_21885 [Amycolatopsis sp. WAC 04169]